MTRSRTPRRGAQCGSAAAKAALARFDALSPGDPAEKDASTAAIRQARAAAAAIVEASVKSTDEGKAAQIDRVFKARTPRGALGFPRERASPSATFRSTRGHRTRASQMTGGDA